MAQPAGGEPQRWIAPDEQLHADGGITTFALPRSNSGPTTIALARDGTVWFTLGAGNAIGRMNPDGSGLIEFPLPHADSAPRVIALGKDGNLWFSEHAGNRIGRVTPEGEIAEFDIPTPSSQPRALALGADGNIWFGEFAAGKIGRITPTGVVTEFAVPTRDSGPRALAAGPDGNIWFSEYKASRIGRMTPEGAMTEFDLPRPNSGPGDITAGADGNLWLVELSGTMDGLRPDGGRVARLTPSGDVTELEIKTATPSPINIAVGPDRNVWFTQGGALNRIAADGKITVFPLPGEARAVGLSAGSDRRPPDRLTNRLWFADGVGNRIGYLSFVRREPAIRSPLRDKVLDESS